MKGLKQNAVILHPGIEYAKMGYFCDKHTVIYWIYEFGFSLKRLRL